MGYKKHILGKLCLVAFYTLVGLAGYSFFNSSHASAATACAITNGTLNDYAGLVATTRYITDTGAAANAGGSGMYVTVATYGGTSTAAGNVVQVTPSQIALKNDTVTQRVMSQSFRSISDANTGTYCPAGAINYAAILRGDGSSGSPSTSNGATDWVLDCDHTKHPSYFQKFQVSAHGTPNGARAGGTWSAAQIIAPANGESVNITFTYTQPALPTVDGVKMDNSGTGTYGGATNSAFNSDNIEADKGGSYYHSTAGNPFYFNGAIQLPAGTFTFKDNLNTVVGYTLVGHSWCDVTTNASCGNAYLINPANIAAGASFSIALQNGHKYHIRFIYKKIVAGPVAPVVSLTCNSSDILSGSATDANKSGTALSIQFYRDGSAFATGVTTTNSSGAFSTNVSSSMGGAAHTFYVIAKGINGSGVPDGINGTSPTVTCSPPASLTADCSTPYQTTSTPEAPTPSPTSGYTYVGSAPSGSTGTPSAQQATETGGAGYEINNAYDQYSTPVGWSASGRQAGNSFTLDYTNYSQYPYDSHTATVLFTEYYTEQQYYSSSNPDGYTCPRDSATLSGSTCSYNASYSCPATDYPSGNKCYKNSDNTFDVNGTPYCPTSTDTLSGTTCSYTGTPYYKWHTGSTAEHSSQTTYVVSPVFPECFDRGFSVTTASQSIQVLNDAESPNDLRFQGTFNVNFFYPSGSPSAAGFQTPPKVNIGYAVSYYVVPFGQPDNGASGATPLPISCPNPGDGFNVLVTGSHAPSTAPASTSTVDCTGYPMVPPLQPGDQVCVQYDFSPTGDTVDETGFITSNNGQTLTTHNCSTPIVNEPYVHTFGLDASAGGDFASGANGVCTSPTGNPGQISAFLKSIGLDVPARGSGSQFGALALGPMSGFASSTLRASAPDASFGLTFANNSAPAAGGLSGQHCIPDYFATKSAATTATTPALPSHISLDSYNGNGSGNATQVWYTAPNGLELDMSTGGGAGIAKGNRVAVYVDGDVYIHDNIVFKQTSWTSVADIPTFYLIVHGNIFIDPGVSQLDGVYVAQSSGAGGGTIYTCAPGTPQGTNLFSALYSASALYNSCSGTQLHVNGTFIANNINLLRTAASLRNSLEGEQPQTTGDCTGGDGDHTDPAYDCAAEIFDFSPETYLGLPGFNPIGNNKLDYDTSLSPVL